MDSNLSSSASLVKFKLKDYRILYAKLNWKQNDLDLLTIKIYDGEKCWSGRFSTEFAEIYRNTVNENKEEYVKNVMECLRDAPEKYTFDFTVDPSDCNTGIFSWYKKHLDTVVIHGAIPVHYEDSQSNEILIDFLLQENTDLNLEVEEYTVKNNDLSADLQKCKNELRQFINLKTSLEATLVDKFEQLLNTKKRRIQLFDENHNGFESSIQIQIGDGE